MTESKRWDYDQTGIKIESKIKSEIKIKIRSKIMKGE